LKEACVSVAMDEDISARNVQRKTRPVTNNTFHRKRSNSALKRDDASLVKSRGTLKGAQTETPETKLKTSQTGLWVGKTRPIWDRGSTWRTWNDPHGQRRSA